jgi:uncharacterized membrane protein YphA (DoxX/SURF4 family)
MVAVVVVLKLLLSGVFVVAGLSKLADPVGSRKALLDFGFAEWLSAPLAILLPVSELGIGVGLLLTRFTWYAAGGALILLAAFIVVITILLSRGRKPDCHCFGQLHSKPIGWDLVARNTGLGIIAGLVLYAGPKQPGVTAWIGNATAGHQLQFLAGLTVITVMGAHCWLTFQLVQQSGRLLVRLEEIEKRIAAPGHPFTGQPQFVPLAQEQGPQAGLRIGESAPGFSLKNLKEGMTCSMNSLLFRNPSSCCLSIRIAAPVPPSYRRPLAGTNRVVTTVPVGFVPSSIVAH